MSLIKVSAVKVVKFLKTLSSFEVYIQQIDRPTIQIIQAFQASTIIVDG